MIRCYAANVFTMIRCYAANVFTMIRCYAANVDVKAVSSMHMHLVPPFMSTDYYMFVKAETIQYLPNLYHLPNDTCRLYIGD